MIKRLIFSLCLACAALPAFAAFDLAQLMSDISEDAFAAGWLIARKR